MAMARWWSLVRQFSFNLWAIFKHLIVAVSLALVGLVLMQTFVEPVVFSSESTVFEVITRQLSGWRPFFLFPALIYFMYNVPPYAQITRSAIKYILSRQTHSRDIGLRALNSEVEQIERRIAATLRLQMQREWQSFASDENIVSKVLDRRLKDGLITAVDDALLERTGVASKKIRVEDLLVDVADRLRLKYDGPASRAEQSAIWSRRFSYVLAFSGLFVAAYRVFTSSGFMDAMIALIQGKTAEHFWPLVFAQAAPWLGLVLLIEFTALIFFKFYVRSIELQRYFTRELANSESRFGALRVITELGTPEQSVSAALALIALQENNLRADFADDDVKQAGAVGDLLSKVKDFMPGRTTAT